MKRTTVLLLCLIDVEAQLSGLLSSFASGFLNGLSGSSGSSLLSSLASATSSLTAQSTSSSSTSSILSSGSSLLGVDINTLASAAMVTSQILEDIPLSTMTAGLESLRTSGLLKQANLGSTSDSVKMQSLPPSGTAAAKGMCYTPSKADDGTMLGGLTACIPADAINVDASDSSEWPRLGWSTSKSTPDQCRSVLMSKGSQFDGYYCATTQYSDPTCLIDKYQASDNRIVYEARLVQDTSMNNVIVRCLIEQTSTGAYRATTDVNYEISVSAVKNADTSVGAQAVDVLNVLPTILSSNNVASFFTALGADVGTVDAQSEGGETAGNVVDSMVSSNWYSVLKELSNTFVTNVVGSTTAGQELNSQSEYTYTNTTIGNLASFLNTLFSSNSTNTSATRRLDTGFDLSSLASLMSAPISDSISTLIQDASGTSDVSNLLKTVTNSSLSLSNLSSALQSTGLVLDTSTLQNLLTSVTAESASSDTTSRTTIAVSLKDSNWSDDPAKRAEENAKKVAAAQKELEKETAAAQKQADKEAAAAQKQADKEAAAAAKAQEKADKEAAAAAAKAQKEADKAAEEEAAYQKAMQELLEARDGHLYGTN